MKRLKKQKMLANKIELSSTPFNNLGLLFHFRILSFILYIKQHLEEIVPFLLDMQFQSKYMCGVDTDTTLLKHFTLVVLLICIEGY